MWHGTGEGDATALFAILCPSHCLRACVVWCGVQCHFPNGDVFDGQSKDGHFYFGEYKHADPVLGRYRGLFNDRDQKQDKDGLQFFGNGNVYRGQFDKGEGTGQGIVSFPQLSCCPPPPLPLHVPL